MGRRRQMDALRLSIAGILGFLVMLTGPAPAAGAADFAGQKLAEASKVAAELKLAEVPFKIVHETYRGDNWELFMRNADGSDPVNLTRTSNVDEMYPHVSPDGTKICFVADETIAGSKVRNVYYMNIDGTERRRVAVNGRQPCWSPDGKSIAYLNAEFDRYTTRDYATRELIFYDLRTGRLTQHSNKNLLHLYAICWTPDSNWFFATVHGGMGFSHAQLALQARGDKVVDLSPWGVGGCRPDVSADGKYLTWGKSDEVLCAGVIDVSSGAPRVTGVRDMFSCPKGFELYHAEWSPDGKFIAFSFGPAADEIVGGHAKGWNICVGDLTGKWTPITIDGMENKEPDWVPTRRTAP